MEGDAPVIKDKPARVPAATSTSGAYAALRDLERDGAHAKAWARAIVDTFIANDAPAQINIGAELQQRLLSEADAPDRIPSFSAAQREVQHMMRLPFQMFVHEQLARNIDWEERRTRYRTGAALLALGVALGLLLRYLAVGAGLPRWGLFLVLLPVMGAALHQLTSARMGICDHEARLGSSLLRGEHVLVCELAAHSHARRARLLFAYFVPVTLVASAFFAALPPYPPY